jgi:hypothetical protein
MMRHSKKNYGDGRECTDLNNIEMKKMIFVVTRMV